MRVGNLIFLIWIVLSFVLHAQQQENTLFEILKGNSPAVDSVLAKHEQFKVQILFSRVNRGEDGVTINTHSLYLDSTRYFNPASTVKLPAALLSLEKINNLAIPGLTKYSRLEIDSSYKGQKPYRFDPTAKDSIASIAQFIKRIFVVSDNESYSRLYEFLGRDSLNIGLWNKGFTDTKILQRFTGGFDYETNKYTNGFTFYNAQGNVVYKQAPQYSAPNWENQKQDMFQGTGHYAGDDTTVTPTPFDFTRRNFFSLQNMHSMLIALFFPDQVAPSMRFNLSEDDRVFLREVMSMLPRESKYPKYQPYEDYPDGFVKFAMYGDVNDSIPDNINIYNKIGLAFGYVIENAYIVDEKNGIEFFVSAVAHSNADGIMNDGIYEYDTVLLPFLGNLGRVLYDYEVKNLKK